MKVVGLLLLLSLLACLNGAKIPTCTSTGGLNKLQCAKLSRTGCPVRFLGKGCGKMKDGGCQPSHVCPSCCKQACKRANKTDKRCLWTGNECIACHAFPVLADNGLPLDTMLQALVWSPTVGLGDSFSVFSSCSELGQYITGFRLFMQETNPALVDVPISHVQRVRIFVFDQFQVLALDWVGNCRAESYHGLRGVFQVECDFVHEGVQIVPRCRFPSFPAGKYDVLVSHESSTTLGWLSSLPNTGCQSNMQCAFSQPMVNTVLLPRVEYCDSFQNLAFQILGSASPPEPTTPACEEY